ncbi:MAG: AraC family transcriptional regulator [Marinilabiliaceae bacterium]|nr:AraC family transcriptional regulator [Marinilabiliaceae bacterium]
MKYIIISIFLLFVLHVSAEENPFIEMDDKPYNQYFEYLEGNIYREIEERDSIWVNHIVAQMREAAKVSKNKKWTHEADFCEGMYRFFRDQKTLYKPNNQKLMDSLAIIFIDKMQPIIQQVRKIDAFDVELRIMFRVWVAYTYDLKNYEIAFQYGLEFDKALSKVSAEEFPLRPRYYSEIGKLYYSFREYETARYYFEKGLVGVIADNLSITNQAVIKTLWNNMGLIYRYHYNDLEKSDSCFLQITEMKLQYPNQLSGYDSTYIQHEYELWMGIAKGNLGTNHHLRNEYQQAIPLLKYSIEKATDNNNQHNFPYAIGKAILLSEIFIEQSDLPQAKLYLDKAADFLDRLQKRSSVSGVKTQVDLWVNYYKMMTRYYRSNGDNAQALLYADSTAEMQILLEDEFNLRKLHRVEQQVKQEKLDAEIFRSKTYFRGLIIISVFSILLIALSLLLYRLYSQKQAAYKNLTIKTKQWAEIPVKATETTLPDQKNKITFDVLTQLMTDKQLYRKQDISLDHTAKLLGVNRVYLSQTINYCKGGNFNNFVNEFRVKEAVILMSDKKKNYLCIEGIAIDVGFNDRKSFYRAFKKFTGLSPSEFRNNLSL